MSEEYEQFLEGNYDSGKEEEQRKRDIAQAQRINNTAQSLRTESRENLINMTLGDELLPAGDEEAIRELINEYALNKDKYLVNGAILTCNMAFTKSQVLRSVLYGSEINNEEVDGSQTLLKIPETNSYINGMPVATVKDHVIDTNIEPFKCNCLNIPDREEEWKAIEGSEECKKYGTCQRLMSLEDDWENIINSTLYLSFNHSVDGQETERAQGVTVNSMLFCRHGGIITPVTSGQLYTRRGTGSFVGYLKYGCGGITQDPSEGYYMLYDGPTVWGIAEAYRFKDIYAACGTTAYGTLQGFGGSGSKLNKNGNHTTYGGTDKLDTSKGTLMYNGIERHAIALGPKLQNPDFDTTSKEINAEEMIYGTCVDVTIELNGTTYYIPAVITDVKAHTAPNGYYQTNKTFAGIEEGDSKPGNIVEWYVNQGGGNKDKSDGLKIFNNNGGLVIYRKEVMD